jgi:hypothetical protein
MYGTVDNLQDTVQTFREGVTAWLFIMMNLVCQEALFYSMVIRICSCIDFLWSVGCLTAALSLGNVYQMPYNWRL